MYYPSRKACTRGFITALLCALLFSLSACGSVTTTDEILLAALSSQKELPAGQTYHSTATPGESAYADETLLATLYGDGTLPIEFASVRAFSVYLCERYEPCELAVFLCASRADAYAVGEMCLRRLDTVKRLCNGTEWAEQSQNGTVSVVGKYVILALCPDPASAASAARARIRKS